MRQAGNGRVPLFTQRVEPKFGMVGQLLRSQRQKLRPDRIVMRIVPIDQTQKVRRNAQRHRRPLDSQGHILKKRLRGTILKKVLDLSNVRRGVPALEGVRMKFGGG